MIATYQAKVQTKNIEKPADVGLDHGVEQGPVGDAQDLPQALHAELGALELGDKLLGEGHV